MVIYLTNGHYFHPAEAKAEITRPYGLMVKRITSTHIRYDEILSSILSEGTDNDD